MKESKTIYSYLIEHMESPSFKKVRDLACDFVRKLPQELCDELHTSLNRGVDVLDSEALLQMYFYSFGEMHAAKLNCAFDHLQQYIKEAKRVELVDYGCGQGMASMCYHDFINNVNPSQDISRVILIEPSEMALSRASLLCSRFYPNAEIVTVSKDFDNLTEKDFELSDSIPTIHLFSNILDVESFNIENLAQLVKTKSIGDNEYVIVSPIQNANRMKRLKDFVTTLENNQYFEQYLDKREFREDKDWTCAVLMCSTKNEKEDIQLNLNDEYETQVPIEELDLSVSEEELLNAWTDEHGVKYSKDRKKLLKAPSDLDKYVIRNGTKIICNGAFEYTFLESIVIPETIVYIGDYAFSDSELKEVHIPDSVKSIGKVAFRDCKLTRVVLSKSITIISPSLFQGCDSLEEIDIPENVERIGSQAFMWCSNLKKVHLHEGLKYIENGSFVSCSNLEGLTIPSTVLHIGENPYEDCHCQIKCCSENYKIKNGMLFTSDMKTLISCLYNSGDIEIPNGVETIGRASFIGGKNITSILIPNSVKSICDFAFQGCSSLKSITIPKSVNCIGGDFISDCGELREIKFLCKNVEFKFVPIFGKCNSLEVILIPKGTYSHYFDCFEEQWWLRDRLVEGTNKSIFNSKDRDSILEALHKNTMFRYHVIEKTQ